MSTWVLLRGLTREKGHWQAFPQQLAEAFPEFRVVCLELPGNGELHALRSPSTVAGMAAHARAKLRCLGLPPPYHLLAMSMGAMVAAAWAEEHTDEIRACVLVNTSFGAFSPLHHRLRPRAWPVLLRVLLARSEEAKERLIFALTTRLAQPASSFITAWADFRRARPVSLANAVRQGLAAARFRAPEQPPAPTLLLAGSEDGLVDPRCSMAIASRWGCAIALHPTAGHDLPLDDGAWVATQARGWLRSLENARDDPPAPREVTPLLPL
jgi:pimeloyl-ACP methyl ester carboxylesterase